MEQDGKQQIILLKLNPKPFPHTEDKKKWGPDISSFKKTCTSLKIGHKREQKGEFLAADLSCHRCD